MWQITDNAAKSNNIRLHDGEDIILEHRDIGTPNERWARYVHGPAVIPLPLRVLKSRILAVSTAIGLGWNYSDPDPVKALFWSAGINGIIAVPQMLMLMLSGSCKSTMGDFVLLRGLKVGGWLSTAVMALAAAGLFLTWGGERRHISR